MLGVIGLVVIALWLSQLGQGGGARPGGATLRSSPPASQAEGEAEVRRLIAAGDLIAAIKQYRTLTGVGLKEAKEAVEALAAGRAVPALPAGVRAVPVPVGAELEAEIRAMVKDGRLIEAIKRYREATGVGLSDAKAIVERMHP